MKEISKRAFVGYPKLALMIKSPFMSNVHRKLRCPQHHLPLEQQGDTLRCPENHTYPIVREIPRFVSSENYAAAFGAQWNAYRQTQLDSYSGVPITRDRLTRMAGGSLEILHGKAVLEAGCGAGRFTEILLDAGANVFAFDLSNAVEANYQNHQGKADYFVCQADIRNAPVEPASFDVVVCVGVIQHTPDPETTIRALCSYVKPGGLLIIDHYTHGHPETPSRRWLRKRLLGKSPTFTLRFCQFLVGSLWGLHRLSWAVRNVRGVHRLRKPLLHWSPVVDYHDAYPQLGAKLLYMWAVLDTHDTLTDVYKHLRSAEDIANHLRDCGMTGIETTYAGNGVEARARKPLSA
jgi:SAM-dependent methyltransferase